MRRRGKLLGLYLPPALMYGLIFCLSSLRTDQFPRSFLSIPDIVPHFVEYFLLAFLIRRIFTERPGWSAALLSFLVSGLLGFLDELHQLGVPTRTFSWTDIGSDLAGISAAIFLFFLCSRARALKFERRSEERDDPSTL